MIEKALAEIHYNVLPNKSTKSQVCAAFGHYLGEERADARRPSHQQVLDAIRQLQEANTIPIQRARMRIRLTMLSKDGKRLKDRILEKIETVEEDEWSEEWELVSDASGPTVAALKGRFSDLTIRSCRLLSLTLDNSRRSTSSSKQNAKARTGQDWRLSALQQSRLEERKE